MFVFVCVQILLFLFFKQKNETKQPNRKFIVCLSVCMFVSLNIIIHIFQIQTKTGTYINAPYYLAKIDVQPTETSNSIFYTIIISQLQKKIPLNCSLEVKID
jgi:hypothetical protein